MADNMRIMPDWMYDKAPKLMGDFLDTAKRAITEPQPVNLAPLSSGQLPPDVQNAMTFYYPSPADIAIGTTPMGTVRDAEHLYKNGLPQIPETFAKPMMDAAGSDAGKMALTTAAGIATLMPMMARGGGPKVRVPHQPHVMPNFEAEAPSAFRYQAGGAEPIDDPTLMSRMLREQAGAIGWHGSPHKGEMLAIDAPLSKKLREAPIPVKTPNDALSAYEYGKKLRMEFPDANYQSTGFWEDVIYSREVPNYLFSDLNSVFMEAGFRGDEIPKYVKGWRFGNIPKSKRSYNSRDNEHESGTSLWEVYGGDKTQDEISGAFIKADGRKKINVEGWLHPYRKGGDGEPLLVDPIESKKIKNGKDFLEQIINSLGSEKAAYEHLKSLGIQGIKYFDDSIHTKGTSNYVLFDDKLPTILERNGQPLMPDISK